MLAGRGGELGPDPALAPVLIADTSQQALGIVALSGNVGAGLGIAGLLKLSVAVEDPDCLYTPGRQKQ
jgi:hypothetical protein